MAIKQYLTNEEFANAYDNKFKLALEIIAVAQSQMRAGQEVTLGRLINEFRKGAQLKMQAAKAEVQVENTES